MHEQSRVSQVAPVPASQAKPARNWPWFLLSMLVIVLDQWAKGLATEHLRYAEPVTVIPDLLNWTLLHNYGAAFSMLADAGGWQKYLFSGLAILVSLLFATWIFRLPRGQKVLALSLALILGGAIGTLIDRLTLGYVVDYIHVYWQDHHFPAFNIADSAITLGVIGLIYDMLFLEKRRRTQETV